MKKRSVKKIRLNRETLRVLDHSLDGVVGGATTTLNPTVCAPASNCATCNDTCPIRACGTGTHTCPP